VQEAFVVRGDCLLGERGPSGAGSCFWRPLMVWHRLFATRDGLLFLSRSKGGGLEVKYKDVPNGRALVGAHVAAEPYFSG
jgi:hypothetical protein